MATATRTRRTRSTVGVPPTRTERGRNRTKDEAAAAAHAAARTMKGAVERGEIEAAAAAPAAQFVTRKVGPLPVRFSASTPPDQVPTIASLAEHARSVLNAKAGVHGSLDEPLRRQRLLEAKPTREAAAFSTAVLVNPKTGEHYTLAQRSALITLVRKQLVADLRAAWKRADAEKAAAAKAAARIQTGAAKARTNAAAKAQRTANLALLPENAKPSKALSKDQTRPVLNKAHLCQTPDGDGWQLVCTNSYQACIFPLKVYGNAGLTECTIDAEAVKAIEKGGAFRIEKDQLVPLNFSSAQATVKNPAGGPDVYYERPTGTPAGSTRYAITQGEHFPRMRDDGKKGRTKKGEPTPLYLKAPPAPSKRMEMTFNAHLLEQLQAALGSTTPGGKNGVVTIAFSLDDFVKQEDGRREWQIVGQQKDGIHVSPSIRVESTNGSRGHMMPVRKNV